MNYYINQLENYNDQVESMRKEKMLMAEKGNTSIDGSQWLSHMISMASDAAATLGRRDSKDEDGLILGFGAKRSKWSAMCTTLDFFFGGFSLLTNRNYEGMIDSVTGSTMSSTGFVTFNDLSTVACANSAPLSHDYQVLKVQVAPDPRDVRWENAHINASYAKGREWTANFLLVLGAVLWSIPIASIQALATVEHLATIPGFHWMNSFNGGPFSSIINGYLPVVALLTIIGVLPFVFKTIAEKYEFKKTQSDVEQSILARFYYYQLANIYITVTAGSIWTALGAMIDHPGSVLEILGRSLPTVVGYFLTFIMTKTLAGLPLVMLRPFALIRMITLRLCFWEKYLTQREVKEVYKTHSLAYGCEYPQQLLVITICFTYACICPIILPMGALFFLGALLVYKKQILLVYVPTHESGGAMFPSVCHRVLCGLIAGQITLIGYSILRHNFFQPLALIPLPIITTIMIYSFHRMYAETSAQVSLERATELDKRAMVKIRFTEDLYRQPVLTQGKLEPQHYRASNASHQQSRGGSSRQSIGVLHNDSGKLV